MATEQQQLRTLLASMIGNEPADFILETELDSMVSAGYHVKATLAVAEQADLIKAGLRPGFAKLVLKATSGKPRV